MASETPEALLRRANQLLTAGDIPAAIEAHERLLAIRPDLPDSWYNLGYLHRCARQFEAALAAYSEALGRGVAGAEEVHVNRAVILSEHLDRGEEAEAELKAALRVNPHYLVAWLNLGNLYEDWGEPLRARSAYEEALKIAPGNGRALARLTAIRIFEGQATGAPERLRQALGSPGISIDDAAELAFALGSALDTEGAYDDAFSAFSAANRISRDAAPPGSRYDRQAQEALVDALISMPLPAAAGLQDPRPPQPIFICGMFRSGSTLAEQILARHSRVTAGGELEYVPAMVKMKLQPYPQALAQAQTEMLNELQQAYLAELRSIHPTADIVTDKRVDNFLHIGLIKSLFPQARIVHTVREPLDNILSVYFLHFDSSIAYGTDLADIAHFYRQYRRLMAHWKSVYGEDIFDFSYDEVVTDPEPAIRRLLDFCGLGWEPGCLAATPNGGPVRTASSWQVRQPLHARSSGRWRNYERHLGAIRDLPGLA